jgi:hypothetical protein
MSKEKCDVRVSGQVYRSRWALGLVCCGLLLSVLWLVRVRYAGSRNFELVHVQATGEEWQECRVFYQSIYGSWGQLIVDRRHQNRWMQFPSVNGVVRVLVDCPGAERIPAQAVEVRVGNSWGQGRAVRVRGEMLPDKLPVDVRPCWTCFEFYPPIDSWLPRVQSTINWQGDLWLFAVPLVQVLTLSGLAMVCWLFAGNIRRAKV